MVHVTADVTCVHKRWYASESIIVLSVSDSKHPRQSQELYSATLDFLSREFSTSGAPVGHITVHVKKSIPVTCRSCVLALHPSLLVNMPTTTTLTMSPTPAPFIPLKLTNDPSTDKSPPTSSPTQPQQLTATTLRRLYTRAVRAFLHRDIVLTHSLLTSAFALITPPLTPASDSLAEHRRKWDVLRITLDVTVYTDPPPDSASIPTALRSNALVSAAALLASLHTRSLRLFAPADGPATPNSAFLPAQVLVTLAFSSAKIGCPTAGRGIIEEWLACRALNTSAANTVVVTAEDGYEKVLEIYILNILPALGEWAYARQFLGYETELPVRSREVCDCGR